MLETNIDLVGNDLVWRNKPDLPAANEENRKLEAILREKKIEIERLRLILQNNIDKGKNMQDHFNNLGQTLSYKQQLYKTKEHELEMEVHIQRLLERECSRHEQEIKLKKQEIKSLTQHQSSTQAAIAEQTEKREKLKSAIKLDEDSLMNYLEKSAQMEKDNMALLKYASEDDSKINELELQVEKLSKEVYERKSALDDADTEVFIVQSELDKMQEEFRNAYKDRNTLISNWEKVMNQIQLRSDETRKLSEYIVEKREEEKKLRREEKEQLRLLSSETLRNNELEDHIKTRNIFAENLHKNINSALSEEEELRAELTTKKNVSNYLLYQKQITENTLSTLEKQLEQKSQKIEDFKKVAKNLERDIETLNNETLKADHYIKELEKILQKENLRNLEIQKEVENLTKDILLSSQELKKLKAEEKYLDNQTKNCQADIRNLNLKIAAVDRLRAKQESEMYEIESNFEKLQRRIKKMVGITNEEEKRQIETQKSQLLSVLDEKKKSLTMLTEELKIMMEKIAVSTKELEMNKKLNTELEEKIKSLEFCMKNSQKALKCSVSRKQELLVQECFIKFQMKRYKKILRNRNKSVFTLQKSKAEFEAIVKGRTEELKNCNDLIDAEIRSEEEECSLVRRKLRESEDKLEKLISKYKIIMDALGVSEPGESAEAEMLIKAEEEKRDLQYERDQLMSTVMKNEEELSALKNTLWMINAANEQFRQVVYPAGISLEDSETLRNTEEESQALGIKLHIVKAELKTVEDSVKNKKEVLSKNEISREELQNIIHDREAENETISKQIADVETKITRAERTYSQLSLDLKKKDNFDATEEDIRIHLLREIRRTVSDLLFAAVESKPEVAAKLQQLFEESQIPLPARARSSVSSRSSSASSLYSRNSSKPPSVSARNRSSNSSPSSSRTSSRMGSLSPSVVTLGELPFDFSQAQDET